MFPPERAVVAALWRLGIATIHGASDGGAIRWMTGWKITWDSFPLVRASSADKLIQPPVSAPFKIGPNNSQVAIKPFHLHLLDWREVSRVRIDRDRWQQHAEPEVMKVRRLPHNIVPR